jgi:mono/diheme cytochrome c family protein
VTDVNKTRFERSFLKSGLATAALVLTIAMGGFLIAAEASAADAPAKPAAAAAAVDPGKQLFLDWGCATCHTLADAGADGHVGPVLDGDPNLTKPFIVNRVTNGQGAMPSFGGQLSDKEIGEIADYLVKAAAKPAAG